MKRVFTLLFIVISVICSASAHLAQLDDGYYRIQCVETGRYISFRNNYVDTESFQSTLQGEFHSLRTISGFENVVNDPGSIIYIKKYDEGWALRSQGYSFDNNFFIQISDMGDDTYRLWTTTTNADLTITRYLCDYDETKGGYNYSYVTTDTNNKKGWDWRLIPVTAEDQKYFGLVPEVNVGGKGYTTFYASIPVRLSSGMKAYVVDSETETTFTPMYIGDEVPANTPVIIECTGDNASDNKLTPLESSSVSVGTNCLSGVMFCYPVIIEETENRENPYWNALDYNSTTMRMIGVAGGKLAFVTPNDQDYMPANKAYLNVTSSSAATLSTTGSTFTATVEDIDMVFTVLNESPKTCQVGYLDGSFDKPAINKEAVNGSLTIPNIVNGYTVVKIGKWALNNVDGMTSITIPNTVTSFDDYAFHSCDGLESFELPASVTSLGEGALSSIWNVTSLTVAEGNTTFDSRDNCNAIIESATNKIVAGCQTTTIPASVTKIGTLAFDLSRGSIFIPSTVSTIEERAFMCINVTIQVERTTPLEINANAFDDDMTNSILRVPDGCKSAYAEAAGWNKFSTILESTFTAKTTEGIDMVFTILDESEKTCQVGYLDGAWDKTAVNKSVKGSLTIPNIANGYKVVKIGKYSLNNVVGMTSVTIPNTVTSIDDYAFFSCGGLTSFELPASVTSLGTGALSAFSNVTSLTVAEGNTTFDSRDNCNAIIEKATNKIVAGCQTTIIPASATGIGTLAFDLFQGSIFIPSTITTIEESAFSCINAIIQVERTTPLEINTYAFNDNITNSTLRVPAGSKSAYAKATGWSKFGMILEGNEGSTFTAKTTENWDMVFTILDDNAKTCQVGYLDGAWDKTAVDNDVVEGPVTIPETVNDGYTVVKIGRYAFQNTLKMTSITIPNTVTGIDNSAFGGCWGMTNLEIPASVTSIGDDAFYGISKASSISVKEGNTKYDSRNNCNAIIETATNKLLFGCKNTIIPSTVTEIGREAFAGLNNCTLTIPSTITKIGEIAFSDCLNTTIQVEHTVPLNIDVSVFQELNNSTLRVPAGSKSAYAAATGWSKFGADNIIEENKVTINVETAGGLSAKLSDPLTITDLTITGQLNGTDFRLLRAMAGNDYTGHPTEGKLQKLDLSGATIVEGGDPYFESAGIYKVDGSMAAGQGEVQNLSTEKDVVGPFLFAGCAQLSEVKIPSNTEEIGDWAFMMTNISALDIPEGVEKVWPSFSYETRVSTITIPKTVTDIVGQVGQINPYLSSIIVDPNNTKYNSSNNCNAVIETNTYTLVLGCKNTIIPDDTKIIGSYAFSGDIGESITLPQGLQTIGQGAFSCSSINTITIPASISQIEGDAFVSCYNLATITVDAANETYESPEGSNAIIVKSSKTLIVGCKSTIIPSDVKVIGPKVFNSCNSLTSITIPASIESIGYSAFGYCHNLTSVTVEAVNPLVIDASVFSGPSTNATLYVPAGSKTAYQAADYWKEFKEIVEVEAPSGNIEFANDKVKAACVAKWDTDKDGELSYDEAAAVTSLVDKYGDDPFAAQLWELGTGDSDFSFDEFQYFTGVTSLAGHEFECDNLTSIILPNSITSIGNGTFYLCKKLTSIHIPASVTYIYMGDNDFTTPAFNSEYLQTITVDPENTKYASPAGSNAIIDNETNALILGCGNTDFTKIPNTVTTIGQEAFAGVTFANTIVSLPTSVTGIMEYAFMHSNITSINLGELSNLTTIGNEAFSDCKGLTEVTLPASITRKRTNEDEEGIGFSVFANCHNIVKVVSNIAVPLDNSDVYYRIIAIENDAVLYVPEGKKQAYIDKGWEESFESWGWGNHKSFRVITDGDHTDPVAIEGLAYNGSDQKLILPGTYRTGMMEYSLDGSTYSTSVPTGKDAGSYTVYYRKVGESNASTLTATIAHTISAFSGTNLWAGYVAAENLALPTGLKAYVITSLDATTATASPLDYIPQGVPVLLKRENTSDNNFEMSAGSGTAPTVNLLKTYESAKNVSNREGFILYNDEFVLVNEGTLPAGRVFLPANKSGVALTRGIVTEGDDTTGIYNSKMDFDDSDKQWYDIQGRKLERKPTKKGIYILDGRKVVIK